MSLPHSLLLALGLPLLGVGAACASSSGPRPDAGVDSRVERRVGAMGTLLSLEVVAPDRPTALRASEAAVRAIEEVEARLSTWREESELARFHRAPVGAPVELSPELAADLARAAELCAWTEGAFDPAVGALVAAWGLRSGGRLPSEDELAAARAASGIDGLELAGRVARRLRDGLTIEEGGFGKGIGLDAALGALREAGASAALVDLGGQVALLADAGAGDRWIQVAHPRERDAVVLEARIARGSLATTGNAERAVTVGGTRLGHVLDPRTGRPAPDFGSVTVWAADATTADALSTGLFVLGPEGALAFAARHPEVLVLVVEEHGGELSITASEGWRDRLRVAPGSRAPAPRFFPSPSSPGGAAAPHPESRP